MVPILYASSIPYNQQEQRIDAPVPAGTAFGGPELAARSEEFSPVRCLIPFEIPALREDKTDGRHSNQEHILFLLFVQVAK
jgi:hypothetical protein